MIVTGDDDGDDFDVHRCFSPSGEPMASQWVKSKRM